MTTSLFDSEKSVIAAAESALSQHGASGLAGDFRLLLKNYCKLYRQFRLMVRQGDRMQHKLTSLNESLARSEEKYRNIFQNVAQGIFRTTADGRFRDANPAMAAILGYPCAQSLLREVQDIPAQVYVRPEERQTLLQTLESAGHVRGYPLQFRQRGGRVIWVDLSARGVWRGGKLVELEGLLADVTEQRIFLEKLKELAMLDPLTGLYNRRSFMDVCELEFAKAQRDRTPLSLVFFDVDHFKLVNDTYGHDAGDEVLRMLSRLAGGMLRSQDCLGRLGGEEFAVVLPGTALAGARCLAEKLRAAFEFNKMRVGEQVIRVTASFGLAEIQACVECPKQLLKQADVALYKAKSGGRNCVCSFCRD